MPTGHPNTEDKTALRTEIAKLEERLARIERREKALADLGAWLDANQLDREDLGWLYRQMGKANGSHEPAAGTGDTPVPRRGRRPKTGSQSFSRRLSMKRKRRSMTRSQLAAKIGVSLSSIKGWETGQGTPSARNLAKLSTVLGLRANVPADQAAA